MKLGALGTLFQGPKAGKPTGNLQAGFESLGSKLCGAPCPRQQANSVGSVLSEAKREDGVTRHDKTFLFQNGAESQGLQDLPCTSNEKAVGQT